jgi:hypothetical protein
MEWDLIHCLLAAVDNFVVITATGIAEITEALLSSVVKGGDVSSEQAKKAAKWTVLRLRKSDHPISVSEHSIVPTCELQTNNEITSVRWQMKGDYFVSVRPKVRTGNSQHLDSYYQASIVVEF